MRLPVVVGLAALAACSGKKDAEPSQRPAEVGQLVHSDAGLTAVVTESEPVDRHFDDEVAERPAHSVGSRGRSRRPIDITLRSTPSGAQVAVDGTVLGSTPTYWSGVADGNEHEFVFTMRGYAIARYRFVPVASGVIHGRLERIHEEPRSGVLVPPPEVVPPQPPRRPSANPPTAPPTIVNTPMPDASAPGAPAPEPAAPEPAVPESVAPAQPAESPLAGPQP